MYLKLGYMYLKLGYMYLKLGYMYLKFNKAFLSFSFPVVYIVILKPGNVTWNHSIGGLK